METRRFGISGSTLKVIAAVTMLIDHVGAVILLRMLYQNSASELYQTYYLFRKIGRIAFPIYCFLLVEGFLKTHDLKKYLLRVGLFTVISEVPFDLAFRDSLWDISYQNVFFTLWIGLLALYFIKRIEERKEWGQVIKTIGTIGITLTAMQLAEMLRTDYAGYGVFSIVILYLLRGNRILQAIGGAASFLWEIPAPLGFVPVLLYNGKRGLRMKYFFYIFYPAHLLILYAISKYMGLSLPY